MVGSIEEASAAVAAAPRAIAQADAHALVDAAHTAHPQRHRLAKLALEEVESGLAKLASLGHRFALTEAAAAVPEQWPRMVYHDAQGSRVVGSALEFHDLGAGWRFTPLPQPEAAEATGKTESEHEEQGEEQPAK